MERTAYHFAGLGGSGLAHGRVMGLSPDILTIPPAAPTESLRDIDNAEEMAADVFRGAAEMM